MRVPLATPLYFCRIIISQTELLCSFDNRMANKTVATIRMNSITEYLRDNMSVVRVVEIL